ncbi:SpoIIE family protein phosphatase [Orrella sp. JC864]|uniref:SpoIIE family protein phosphatase n=1 Tax=Orrella sp. JC864 TaxID=3120298 RepID=UPI00300942FB
MPTDSLRGKIFLLVVAILVAVAGFTMLVTRYTVTATVVASEQQGVDNVLDLLERDLQARWAASLNDKITAVRGGRRQLRESGQLIGNVLAGYAELAERGVLTPGAAQGMARRWINQLELGGSRYAMVFDEQGAVLASGRADMIDRDLSQIRDFKSRPLAQTMYAESRKAGSSFAIYRDTFAASASGSPLRYAYFGYFRAWNWVVAVSDSADPLIGQIAERRKQMEHALAETLSTLGLAQSGFVFVLEGDLRMIVPPPGHAQPLWQARDAATGQPITELLARLRDTAGRGHFLFDSGQERWRIDASFFKPLGWTVATAVPEQDLTQPAARLLNRQAAIFGAMLVLGLAMAWWVAARMARPLDRLTRYARQLPDEDLTSASPAPAQIQAWSQTRRDEVGRLARSFLFMREKLRGNVASLMNEVSARQRIESELNIARDIQLGLLPLPLGRDAGQRLDLHATMVAAKEVGGDLYDYFPLDQDRYCLVIGDVSDKGVPAALFMAVTRTLIRSTAEEEHDPARIVERVNTRLAENNPNMMFTTLLLGALDLRTGDFTWVNAGHPAPLVVGRDGRVRVLEGRSGAACGVAEGLQYRKLHTRVLPGEMIVGYTDGVTEAFGPGGDYYGEERLQVLLRRTAGSAQARAQALLEDVRAFAQDVEQSDDITLIVASLRDE